MTLKDATAFNIQFWKGKPVLIYTLSFERLIEGKPWQAYRQFCEHFLAPLALMAYKDFRLSRLSSIFIDGVPLDLAVRLRPFRSRFNISLMLHLHLHAYFQSKYAGKSVGGESKKLNPAAHSALIDQLDSCVQNLKWTPDKTIWSQYANEMNYTSESLKQKEQLVAEFLDEAQPKSVWDLGANTGRFSRLASERGIETVSFDLDPICVEENYRQTRARGDERLLSLILDLTNPTPLLGWDGNERVSFSRRGPVDLVMALALIHHIAIGNNVPLARAARFFARPARIFFQITRVKVLSRHSANTLISESRSVSQALNARFI